MLIPYLIAREDRKQHSPEVDEARRLWREVVQQIEREAPHTVILSSEQLFRAWNPTQMASLVAKLRAVATTVTVVAYIREPAVASLSFLQQVLKTRALPDTGVTLLNPRSALEAYQAAGFDALKVRAFDRSLLVGGSVVGDFFATTLPDVSLSDIVIPDDDNTSMSAEAMAVLQDIHSGKRRFHIGKPRREVRRVDQNLAGFSRPKLRPEVRDAIHASFEDYDWLRDNYDVNFLNIKVPDMDPDAARAILSKAKTIEDICLVDSGRKAMLWQKLVKPVAMLRRLFRPA